MLKEIPVIEIDGRRPAGDVIGEAFHDIGFVFVRAPWITHSLAAAYAEFKKVFALPAEVKQQYARKDIHYQRGWTPPRAEKAIAEKQYDEKENWFMGPDFGPDHPLVRQFPDLYHANIWPKEVPSFAPLMKDLYSQLFDVGRVVLRLTGRNLEGVAFADHLEEIVQNSPTVMRAIYYPPISEEQVGKVVWGGKHTDINLITVLPASTRSGLWIQRRDGEWIPGTAPEGCVIVQVADMLEYLTGGYLRSAMHEVRAPQEPTAEGRYSAALFIHARSNVVLEPNERYLEDATRHLYPPTTAGELLLKRLKEIGLAM